MFPATPGSRAAVLSLALMLPFAGCAQPGQQESTSKMTPAEFVASGSGADGVVVDVRTPAEFADAHLASAINLDYRSPEFRTMVAELDRESTHYVYCRTGNRSAQAQAVMLDMGFQRVIDLGGLSPLVAAGAELAD